LALFDTQLVSRLSVKRWLSGAALASVLVSAGPFGEPMPLAAPGQPAADGAAGCRAVRLGDTTVATLRNVPVITLFANGAAVTLLLDTGAETTILTPAAAQRIGAQRPRIEFQRQMRGIAGSLQTGEVELRSFTIGGVAMSWRRVRVAPINTGTVFAGPLDGVLGADTLSSFDIDLDLPGHRVIFYAKQTCPNAVPAWSQPYARIGTGRSFGGHLFFPVQLDGHRVDAFIDTGSQLTVLSTAAASALGVTGAILARDQAVMLHGAAAEQLGAHAHRFSQLQIGPELIRNPELVVTDIRLDDADIVLGIDFLSSQRLWMSYGSQQIFLMRR
jgi:predicted aspartyl protease